MYFTEMFGQGSQWTDVGQTALYSSHKTGFRVYIQVASHLTPLASWKMNSLGHQLQWCGVGRSTGPKQAGVCCGTTSDFVDTWGVVYSDVSTKGCGFGGTPMYISGVSGHGATLRYAKRALYRLLKSPTLSRRGLINRCGSLRRVGNVETRPGRQGSLEEMKR